MGDEDMEGSKSLDNSSLRIKYVVSLKDTHAAEEDARL
jgi:hypothetical protein